MTYVVCEPCRDCKYTDCVVVCPCDCFYQDDHQLYIDPENCIDCGGCVPVCPVSAIKAAHHLPADKREWIDINRRRAAETPVLTGRLAPLPGADERKRAILQR